MVKLEVEVCRKMEIIMLKYTKDIEETNFNYV